MLELLGRIQDLEFSLCPATIEDYQGALNKACLKSPPHPPDGKADEMRDLVIWQAALRVAAANGGAILLSRDEVHTHHRGDIEADAHGLRRTGDFDRALEMLDLESDASVIIRSLLSTKWPDIVASELPMQQGATLLMARDPIFSISADGLTSATAVVTFSSGDGNELRCEAKITYVGDPLRIFELHLRQLANGAAFDRVYEVGAGDQDDYQDRLEALQDMMGDRG
ncbi:hypothetical protein BC374_01450 [Ensifer sp. LC13]|nr:hypothetical protein BC374_01450 [Ensifer sp. LC13]OCP10446.1 hypothetical protein BBX50_01800 [Ensifer sp. LC11]OCP13948.1 hypothetical protein BC362_04155 [Ensifer sp. LC14]OCP32512.1 hypothetical protein BC364_01450 [Ensifer sp. LC499]